ncbi:MAG TPA: DEAD/DEAH box helicase family protein [Opitutaceae bacterium]|nr:DEAD/DEAH box helicase family protein [Opitutaceae bacterium]
MNKRALSERDICTKFITPALVAAGWDVQLHVREEVTFTKGRVIVRGKLTARGESKRADYILYHSSGTALALIEAKDNTHTVGAGMQQALGYAETLQIPFVFSTNGDAFLFHDRTLTEGAVERETPLEAFPSPQALWDRYTDAQGIPTARLPMVAQPYHDDGSGKRPRYYQEIAVNRAVEAVARGQDRLLLVMATGTGKTYVAFQTIWRLWKAGIKKRILFLADRNILVDQTRVNDFKPFGAAMTKITHRKVDKSYEIYLALYQAVSGTEAADDIYTQFSPDFFDLVVIDECHRGSAAEDANWRRILDYFSSATHLGLTATPKETKEVSNITYFGDPIYTYSLKQGIEDGFLAPYKVVRLHLDKDVTGWRPTAQQTDKHGAVIPDRIYNQKDFDRELILEKRTLLVAKKITEFLKLSGDRFAKTIVFCEDIDHAERMRSALANENADLVAQNHRYVMRITGDEPEGKAELDNFINPEVKHPVIATTSKLLTTGVDAQTCKLIVIDQNLQSVAEFKQIIGRGTRLREDFGKLYFTIMDFRKVTELFARPEFDGDPVVIYEPGPDEPPVPPDETLPPVGGAEEGPQDDFVTVDGPFPPGAVTGGGRTKYVVDNVSVSLIAEQVQYYDEGGKLVTESLRDYTRKNIRKAYASLDTFLKTWTKADRKAAILAELQGRGVFLDALAEEVGRDYDAFDLVAHVAFDQPPLTRRERAENVKKRNYFTKYGPQARAVLEALLAKYADSGLADLESPKVLALDPFASMGTPVQLVKAFGGPDAYAAAVRELEAQLYTA